MTNLPFARIFYLVVSRVPLWSCHPSCLWVVERESFGRGPPVLMVEQDAMVMGWRNWKTHSCSLSDSEGWGSSVGLAVSKACPVTQERDCGISLWIANRDVRSCPLFPSSGYPEGRRLPVYFAWKSHIGWKGTTIWYLSLSIPCPLRHLALSVPFDVLSYPLTLS